MPLYLAVASVQAEGEPVSLAADYDAVAPGAGQRLIAVVNNGAWQSAVDVSHPAMFQRIQRRLDEGVWHELHLYSLDARRAGDLADGRRVTMDGQPVAPPAQPARR